VAGPLISVGEIIVALFSRAWDMTKPEMADEIVREVGHVDILIANLAYPHSYAPAHEKTDADLEYAMQRIMYQGRPASDARAQARKDRRGRQRHELARPRVKACDLAVPRS
jgi:hypothetical protein